jgi:hypothetical protein
MQHLQNPFDELGLPVIIDPNAIAIVVGIATERLSLILSGVTRPSVEERARLTSLFAEYRNAVRRVNARTLCLRIQESC